MNHPTAPPPPRTAESGFSIVEVMMSLTLLGLAGLGALSASVSSLRLEATNREQAAALRLTRQVIETLESAPFTEVFSRFNSDLTDDPVDGSFAPGSLFWLAQTPGSVAGSPGLPALPTLPNLPTLPTLPFGGTPPGTPGAPATPTGHSVGDVDQLPMLVDLTFPTDATGQLSEQPTGAFWAGQTFDLDANGAVGDGNLTNSSYKMLPVRIGVTWTVGGQTQSISVQRFLMTRSHYSKPRIFNAGGN